MTFNVKDIIVLGAMMVWVIGFECGIAALMIAERDWLAASVALAFVAKNIFLMYLAWFWILPGRVRP